MSDSPPPAEPPRPATSGTNKRWEPPSPEELQALMPGYTIEKLLGKGGMGAVYKGVQENLERPVAIKIISNVLDEVDASYGERFKNEAKAMAKLSHPGIVAVFDYGQTTNGILYIAMEFIEGTDVAKMISQQGRLHTEHAMAITAHVCDALAYAHERGIIHRDIKPANIMVGYDGVVKVADFGLAKMTKSGESGLTQSGMAMGTLHYMAPEALMLGSAVDHRADIYAVGVMLYQMLTGKLPQGLFEMPSLQVPGLDPRYDGIISKALREDREVRYSSVLDLRRDLDAILTQPVVKVEASAQKAPDALNTQGRPQRPAGPPFRPPQAEVIVRTEKKISPLLWVALTAMLGGAVGLYLRLPNDGSSGLINSGQTAPPAERAAKEKVNVPARSGGELWISTPWNAALDQVQSKGVKLAGGGDRWIETRHTTVNLKKIGSHKNVAVRLRVRWMVDTKHAQIYLAGTNGNVGLFIYRDSLSISSRLKNGGQLASHRLQRPFAAGDETEVVIASVGSHFVAQVGDVFLDGGKIDELLGDLSIGLGSFNASPDNHTAVEFADLAYADLDQEADPWTKLAAAMRMPSLTIDNVNARNGKSAPVPVSVPSAAVTTSQTPQVTPATAPKTEPSNTPSPAPSISTGPATWTDTKGRSITATFKALASGNVLLDIAGKVTPVQLNTLSAESQKLARDLAAAQAPPNQGIAGKAFDAITLADIVKAQDLMKIDQIDASDGRVLTVGTVLIYRTCEGRFGKARVEAPAPFKSDVTLFLSWNTFESDGSTRSSGRSFELRRLSSIDLDEGKLAHLNDGADLHWGLQSADSPYLDPVRRNSAAIAIVPSVSFVPVGATATTAKANTPPSSPVVSVTAPASKAQPLEGAQAGERKVFMLQPGIEMAFRWIPPGTFLMGSPEAEAFRPGTGENQFEVTLTDGFWMAETECTQAQWEAVIGSGNASYFKGASLPVTNLNWEQAAEFCNQLGEALKLPKPWHGRLPTEPQWEYACRAGTTSSLNDGKSLSGGTLCPNLDKLGWYNANSIGTTHEVARKRPNAWGLHDMHGNVREWCSSWFAPYPTRPQRNPRDERSGTARVIRGASFKYSAGGCRAASRDKGTPSEASEGVGFRPILAPK